MTDASTSPTAKREANSLNEMQPSQKKVKMATEGLPDPPSTHPSATAQETCPIDGRRLMAIWIEMEEKYEKKYKKVESTHTLELEYYEEGKYIKANIRPLDWLKDMRGLACAVPAREKYQEFWVSSTQALCHIIFDYIARQQESISVLEGPVRVLTQNGSSGSTQLLELQNDYRAEIHEANCDLKTLFYHLKMVYGEILGIAAMQTPAKMDTSE